MSQPRRSQLAALVAVVAILGLTLGAAATPGPVRAATPDLTIVTAATYDVLPDEGRVAVSVALKVTNHLTDTVTKQFFFGSGYLAVLPGTSGFKLSGGSGSPSVSVSSTQSTYTLLKLNLGDPLPAGATTNLTLTFDLHDPGGAPDRPVRISSSIVTFFVWAFGTADTPGSTVELRLPDGYDTAIGRGPLSGPSSDGRGHSVWTSGRLDAPLAFVADVTAARPGAYIEGTRSTQVGDRTAIVILRSWPDDADWRSRMTDLFLGGLPVLQSEIGVPWPLDGPLLVQEAVIASGGYAGLYDPAARRIDVAYSALPGVILHEAAHSWFNGRLVADRWTAEAFASYYAEVAGAAMKVPVASPELTDELRAAAIPLNAWGPIGAEPREVESYGYAASLALARLIADRAGPEKLQAVWARAAAGTGAYQPERGDTELLGHAPDWRGLLDLFEDVTGTSFEDLWQTWVTRPQDLPALAARSDARATYDAVVTEAAPWILPRSIRDSMRNWEFGAAQQGLEDARAVLRQRTALEREAAASGLKLPAALQVAFEGTGGLASAAAEASAELATVGAIEAAAGKRLSAPDPLEVVGMMGTDPDRQIEGAKAAFAKGDLDGAMSAASTAGDTWTHAEAAGRGRLLSAGLLAASAILLWGLLLRGLRRARMALPYNPRPPGSGTGVAELPEPATQGGGERGQSAGASDAT